MNKSRIYHAALAALILCLLLSLTYERLRENDFFEDSSDDPGYVTELQNLGGDASEVAWENFGTHALVAEGFEQVYLYSGTYELTIGAWTIAEGCYFEVVDRWTNTVLAEGEYTPWQEYHTITFTTESNYEDVVVRSWAPIAQEDGTEDVSPEEAAEETGEEASQETAEEAADAGSVPDLSGTVSVESLQVINYSMVSDGPVISDARWQLFLAALLAALLLAGLFRWFRRGSSSLLALTVLGALTSLPFLAEYIPDGHDVGFHIARIYSLGQSIAEGLLPQRINLSMGGGTIAPLMYPELLLYPAGFMVAAGASVWLAYQATCVLITFLTAFLSYYAARQITDERTAVVFAAVYVLNPYRLNELFLRSNLGEAAAVAFLPLVIVGMVRILGGEEEKPARFPGGRRPAGCAAKVDVSRADGRRLAGHAEEGIVSRAAVENEPSATAPAAGAEGSDRSRRTLPGTPSLRAGAFDLVLGFTGLISTHIVSTLIAALVCAVLLAGFLLAHPRRFLRRLPRLLWVALAAAATVLINLWFLVPFLQFLDWETKISMSSYERLDYTGPYLWQIFMGVTGFGQDNGETRSTAGEMPFTIGFASLLGLLLFAYFCLRDLRDCGTLLPMQRSTFGKNTTPHPGPQPGAETAREETAEHAGNPVCPGESCFAPNGRTSERPGAHRPFLTPGERRGGLAALLLTVCFLYLCSPYCPWEWLCERSDFIASTLGEVQYSWRFLTVAVAAVSAVLAIVLRALARRGTMRAQLVSGALLLICALTAMQTATEYYAMEPYMEDRFDAEIFWNYDYALSYVERSSVEEWILSGDGPAIALADTETAEDTEDAAESLDSAAEDSGAEAASAAAEDTEAAGGEETVSGFAVITDYQRDGAGYVFSFVNTTGSDITVTVPVYWYGLHTAYLVRTGDGTDPAVSSDEGADLSGDAGTDAASGGTAETGQTAGSGAADETELADAVSTVTQFTEITIPGDVTEGTVELRLTEPWYYAVCGWISLGSIAVFAAGLILRRARRVKGHF